MNFQKYIMKIFGGKFYFAILKIIQDQSRNNYQFKNWNCVESYFLIYLKSLPLNLTSFVLLKLIWYCYNQILVILYRKRFSFSKCSYRTVPEVCLFLICRLQHMVAIFFCHGILLHYQWECNYTFPYACVSS